MKSKTMNMFLFISLTASSSAFATDSAAKVSPEAVCLKQIEERGHRQL